MEKFQESKNIIKLSKKHIGQALNKTKNFTIKNISNLQKRKLKMINLK